MKKNIMILSMLMILLVQIGGENQAAARWSERITPRISAAVGTGITYQGYLEDGGTAANGAYDFYFELYDAEIEGTSIITATNGDVAVVEGMKPLTRQRNQQKNRQKNRRRNRRRNRHKSP